MGKTAKVFSKILVEGEGKNKVSSLTQGIDISQALKGGKPKKVNKKPVKKA